MLLKQYCNVFTIQNITYDAVTLQEQHDAVTHSAGTILPHNEIFDFFKYISMINLIIEFERRCPLLVTEFSHCGFSAVTLR